MSSRIKKVITSLSSHLLDAFLVTNDTNIKYLTQFPASESWLLITPQRSFYITDSRYTLEAKKGLEGVTVVEYSKSFFDTVFQIAKSRKVRRIGFDDRHLSLAAFKTFKSHCPKSIKLKAVNNIIESLREIKDASEITSIRKALNIHKNALKYINTIIKPNTTELNILNKLEQYVKSKEAGFSFDSIIASGVNSCFPHAHVTKRKIRRDDIVLVDMGIDYQGYKSDLTRMFLLGKIPKLVEDVVSYVSEAHDRAIQHIRPGRAICDVDYQARNYLAKKKLAKYFGHGLGHGVGLDIHESPKLNPANKAILKEGMVVTIEPAVYIPHKFGVRIEDMVLVTKNGYKILSDSIN